MIYIDFSDVGFYHYRFCGFIFIEFLLTSYIHTSVYLTVYAVVTVCSFVWLMRFVHQPHLQITIPVCRRQADFWSNFGICTHTRTCKHAWNVHEIRERTEYALVPDKWFRSIGAGFKVDGSSRIVRPQHVQKQAPPWCDGRFVLDVRLAGVRTATAPTKKNTC